MFSHLPIALIYETLGKFFIIEPKWKIMESSALTPIIVRGVIACGPSEKAIQLKTRMLWALRQSLPNKYREERWQIRLQEVPHVPTFENESDDKLVPEAGWVVLKWMSLRGTIENKCISENLFLNGYFFVNTLDS